MEVTPELARAIDVVLTRCLAVRESEDVVVVADPPSLELATAFRDAAARLGAEAVLTLMDQRRNHGSEPPPAVAAALAAADVFIAPTSRSLSHTKARKAASETGARGATLPQVTADMLARLMDVDLDVLRERSHAVAARLEQGTEAHVTCPRGSDLRIDLTGRHGLPDDGALTERGAFGNLPCGEGFIAPLSGEGRIFATTLPTCGVAPEPVELVVEGGALARGTGPEGERFFAHQAAHGDPGRNLAELGVGTNDRARVTGNVLEDEKILGTVHVAFGASAGIGGTVSVPIHEDVIVVDVTLDVDGERILEDGRYVL